jgi:exonuclease III
MSFHSNKRSKISRRNNNCQLICTSISAPNFIKHTLKDLKPQIDPNTVVVGNFNIPISLIDRSSRQNINKEILEPSDTIDQMDITDVYRIFHPTTAQYTFFSATHGTFSNRSPHKV